LPAPQAADEAPLVNTFRQLSDATRLRLLLLLSGGERGVTELCDAMRLPQPSVSHHLSLLRMANFVECRRDGKRAFYRLSPSVRVPEAGTVEITTVGGSITINPSKH
jgi:DNA-binding transcriptional ArsR family regulator